MRVPAVDRCRAWTGNNRRTERACGRCAEPGGSRRNGNLVVTQRIHQLPGVIVSRARPVVAGANSAISTMQIARAPAITPNIAVGPYRSSTGTSTKGIAPVDRRLIPYAVPAAVARTNVGKISTWKMCSAFEKMLLVDVYRKPDA